MAATVVINRLTGAGQTETAIQGSSTRASLSDSPSPGTSDPIPIPEAGTNRSWWVNTQLKITLGGSSTIDNIKWYSDEGSFGTGITCQVGTVDKAAYAQATTGGATTGTELNGTNYPGLVGLAAHDSYTSVSPLNVSGTLTNTGDESDIVVYQINVGTTATTGGLTARTFTWQYDETA